MEFYISAEAFGALKRIVEEVKEKRSFDYFNKHCVCNHQIGGDDIELVEAMLKENLEANK